MKGDGSDGRFSRAMTAAGALMSVGLRKTTYGFLRFSLKNNGTVNGTAIFDARTL